MCFYLRYLGMELIEPKKGIYKDGHERADVVEYRINSYCKPIAAMGSRIRPVQAVAECEAKMSCACNGKGCVELGAATLSQNDSEIVMVFHDEAIVGANEGQCAAAPPPPPPAPL